MREIVHLQVGQCGNRVGTRFWEAICGEHRTLGNGGNQGNSEELAGNVEVYFNSEPDGTHRARAVAVDLAPEGLDPVRASPVSTLFRPENLVSGDYGTSACFGTGMFDRGSELSTTALEVIRREFERCGGVQALQLVHSLGGGTGSGLGCLLAEKIRLEYPEVNVYTFSGVPAKLESVPHLSYIPPDPYNIVFSLFHLMDTSDLTFCLDHQALYDLCVSSQKPSPPTHADFNALMSSAIVALTSGTRFTGQTPTDLATLAQHFVPSDYQPQHFVLPSLAPIVPSPEDTPPPDISDVTRMLFDARGSLVSCHPVKGRCYSAAIIFRGNDLPEDEISKRISDLQTKYNMPTILTSFIPTPVASSPSASAIFNSTSLKALWRLHLDEARRMFRVRRFWGWMNFGMTMDDMDFTEAADGLEEMIQDWEYCEEHGFCRDEPEPEGDVEGAGGDS